MRRGFLISATTSRTHHLHQHSEEAPLAAIQPPTPVQSVPAATLVHIPVDHVGCCEHVGLSELLKILRNAGENTPSPRPVIFQIPSIATDTHPIPYETITTCITIPEVRENLLSKGPYPVIDSSEGCHIRVVDITGKGKGCVSTSSIPRVIAPTVMAFPRNFDRTVARQIIGALRTNNWGIGALPGHDVPYGGTGAIISRFNHSCAPNALFRWNEEMFAAEVRALRRILPGEELEGYFSRQARLRDAYGFTCTCELCQRPIIARPLSDNLRSQLESLTSHSEELPDARLWAWARDRHARNDALSGALEQQAVMMEQELYVRPEGWLTVARPLVKIYCALGKTVAARKWAVCAASYTRAATGTDGGWEAVARTPEQTIWWRVRVAANEGEVIRQIQLARAHSTSKKWDDSGGTLAGWSKRPPRYVICQGWSPARTTFAFRSLIKRPGVETLPLRRDRARDDQRG
ncbi:hypothetical protein BGW80DRAFT_1267202 [Lactifluus volemus]|nr:hypothetical protein BGW80DRAFT_1267202 [Lactifluus volemus]